MTKISFEVSARTARLIGQENFSNAEGAIIELVKNCYDADGKVSLVVFDIKYYGIPEIISSGAYESLHMKHTLITSSYEQNEGEYRLVKAPEGDMLKQLTEIFNSENSIYIVDNGEGMDEKTIVNKWMKIGTDNKLVEFTSKEGRIKTGAKGLGRFALDRLGLISNMITCPIDGKGEAHDWTMNWQQFEEQGRTLSDVQADLEEIKGFDYKTYLKNQFSSESIHQVLNNDDYDFSHGTIIRISNLRDQWDKLSLQKLFKSLESLIPPKELGLFFIYQFDLNQESEFGEVSSNYFNHYEYKVESEYIASKLKVKLKIERKELDIERTMQEFEDVFSIVESNNPYDLETLKKGGFEFEKDVTKILKWRKEDGEEFLKDVGDFKFNFYFTKLSKPGKEDFKSYPYYENDYSLFAKSFEKFGGIKIYRDHFRVRPYGEPGDDWLDLGKRQASSPASAGQRVGDWRVRAKQIAGVIDVSRVFNPNLRDKSDRSSLIENTTFETFKRIIVGIISEFEYDRSRILHPFYLKAKLEREKREKEDLRKKAEAIAKELIEEQNKNKEGEGQENKQSSEDTTSIIERKLSEFSTEQEKEKEEEESEKDVELRLLRSLASLGLIVASFDHELKAISNNLQPRLRYLEKHLASLITKEQIKELADNKNPFKLIEFIRTDHDKLKGWIDYSLSSIKTDKRKRKNLNFGNYFEQFGKNWKFVLKERNVNLVLCGNKNKNNNLRAFEIDMDSIFNNLLTNSLEAFKLRKEKYQREVKIEWSFSDGQVSIFYSDNGIGLSDVFADDPNEIFRPFVTSKRDKRGNEIGTGLGMYLVKNVIEDYNGEVELLSPKTGFAIKFSFDRTIRNQTNGHL
ncbi:signal transduction histidine kinase [Algoriphagus sp. 4150]|uniref:ATP-binding protein n=1 Tax=Algoriphagus sp. 4150 TaxID=2817756 RepID=UPI00285DC8D9|nr:ATP-binding protein [Algoriphagus sp. 4150]MDR7130179.1 signal transduction histidine kinase [Algoriphagus sp. 4150]